MMTKTAERTELADIQARADDAASTAQDLRDRVANGDSSVTPGDLAEAEATERLAKLQLEAAEERDIEHRHRAEVERLETERAAMQQEWTEAHDDAEVQEALAAAVNAAVEYLRAVQARGERITEVTSRARALGFEVQAPTPRSPLPALGKAILAQARTMLPASHTMPLLDAPNDSVWGS